MSEPVGQSASDATGDVGGQQAMLIERFRMAYAEAGYPEAVVMADSTGHVGVVPSSIRWDEYTSWRAGTLVYGVADSPCFDCWKDEHSRRHGRGLACRQGDCTAPPAASPPSGVPRREDAT